MKDIICLIPNWLMATHAVHAADSVRKYYPDIPIVWVDDINTQADKDIWPSYNKLKGGMEVYDEDNTKLINYPNSAYILRPHNEHEARGHGNALTDAMKFIYSKWVLHVHADARLIKPGLIEEMLKDTDEKTFAIGDDWTRDGPPNVSKIFCLFRGDLYHQYNLDFDAAVDKGWDLGQESSGKMIEMGYNVKLMNVFGHIRHLADRDDPEWEVYY